MRKVISLLTLAFIAASCGGGGSSDTTSEYSQDSRGKLVISVNFPEKLQRHISNDVDFIKLNLESYFFSPETGSYVDKALDEVTLTPANSTVEIAVPSGDINGLVSLWDNDTGTGEAYPIGGVWIHTTVKSGETKTLDVFVPSGIWSLSSPLKGITRMQITTFPTYEPFGWGNVDFMYVTFNPEWYSQLSQEDYATGIPPLGGIVEQVVAETENGTFMTGDFATVPPFSFIDESKATGEFGIFMWSQEEGTTPIPIKGKFDSSNPSQATLYWFDDISCVVNATLANGTVVSFPLGFECEGLLPTEAFGNNNGSFNGTYTFDNVTTCLVKYSSDDYYYFVPYEECTNPDFLEYHTDIYTVNKVDIAFSVSDLEKTTATISDLPLPWKNMAKIDSFNATCVEGEDNCTYSWQISNPDNHELSCFIEMEDGERYDVNCTDGSFTCSDSTNCTNVQPAKLVVRDEAFVQPLADVKYVEYPAEEWIENVTEGAAEQIATVEGALPEDIVLGEGADIRAAVEGVLDVGAVCSDGTTVDGYFTDNGTKFVVNIPTAKECKIVFIDRAQTEGANLPEDATILAVTQPITASENVTINITSIDNGVAQVEVVEGTATVDTEADVADLVGKTLAEVTALSTTLGDTNVTVETVYNFLSNADGKQITIFDENETTCLLTTAIDDSNNTISFSLANCTYEEYNGNGTLVVENGTVAILDDDGIYNKVVFADNNTLCVDYEEEGNYLTSCMVINVPQADDEEIMSDLTNGSRVSFVYNPEIAAWESTGICTTYYDNGTVVYKDEENDVTKICNYTVENGTVVTTCETDNGTIVKKAKAIGSFTIPEDNTTCKIVNIKLYNLEDGNLLGWMNIISVKVENYSCE